MLLVMQCRNRQKLYWQLKRLPTRTSRRQQRKFSASSRTRHLTGCYRTWSMAHPCRLRYDGYPATEPSTQVLHSGSKRRSRSTKRPLGLCHSLPRRSLPLLWQLMWSGRSFAWRHTTRRWQGKRMLFNSFAMYTIHSRSCRSTCSPRAALAVLVVCWLLT